MHWQDEGLLIGVRPFGERKAIAHVFCKDGGHATGMIYRKKGCLPAIASLVQVSWSGRLESQLGTFSFDGIQPSPVQPFDASSKYLAAACTILLKALPEKNAYPELYAATLDMLDGVKAGDGGRGYVFWELLLLQELGYGLDFTQCAVTGGVENLTHVSPKTGRAVCAQAAQPWLSKLLTLPKLFQGQDGCADEALGFTSFFLKQWVFADQKALPPARQLLLG